MKIAEIIRYKMAIVYVGYEERSENHVIAPNSVFLFASLKGLVSDSETVEVKSSFLNTEEKPSGILKELEKRIEESTGLKPDALDYMRAVGWNKKPEFLNLPRHLGYLNPTQQQKLRIQEIYQAFVQRN